MRKTRRKITTKKKKIKNIVIVIFCIGLLFLTLGIFLYFRKASKPLFLSPIPVENGMTSVTKSDNSTDLLSKKLNDKKIQFEKIETNSSSLVVLLKNKTTVIFSRDKDLDLQIASLQFILTRLTMEGKTFESLDFRYNNPVIKE